MAKITSGVWGGVPATVLTTHLLEAVWDPTYPSPCDMYAYANAYGVVGCKHPGLDITLPRYTRLYAAQAGTLTWIRNPGEPGAIELRIRNAAGAELLYTHLEDTPLTEGQAVAQGQFIGRVGVANSAHLHFEKRVPDAGLGSGWRIVNPEPDLLTPVTNSVPVGFNPWSTNYRTIGDVTLALYQSEFKRKNSPMLSQAQYIWNSARPHSGLHLAQSNVENQYASTGSVILAQDFNHMGLRPWEADPTRSHAVPIIHYPGRTSTGLTMEVPPEATGVIRYLSGATYMYFLRFGTFAACTREWKRRVVDDRNYKGGVYNAAFTLEQFLNIYAPAGDSHPDSGLDNAEIGYAAVVRSMLVQWQSAGAGLATGGSTVAKPPILLVAGHRSTGDPGNPVERNLTDNLAIAYDQKFKAAGYTVAWFQRDVDGDGLSDMTQGDLNTVAVGCRNWLQARSEPLSIMLDLHFNGSTSPVHTIVPDVTGLKSGYAGGAPANDTAANNVQDMELAEAISRKIVAKNPGMTLLTGRFGNTGVMSERDTGVALSGGWRLGMFGATAGQRTKAIRLVIEHGGTNDASRTDFFNRCAAAALEAVQETIPNQGGEVPPPEPPEPPPPGQTYPTGFDLATMKRLFGKIVGYQFDPNGPVSQLWLEYVMETGFAPEIEHVWTNGVSKYFQFSNGLIIWQPTASDPMERLGPTP